MDQEDVLRFFSKKKPEKIAVVLDCSDELSKTDCLNEAPSFSHKSRYDHLKRAIELYLRSKSQISKTHEFGLIQLDAEAQVIVPFSNNPEAIIETLEQMQPFEAQPLCKLDSIFSGLQEELKIQEHQELPYVLHIVLFYGRNNIVPEWADLSVLGHPDVYLDVIYVHDSESLDMRVFDLFREIQAPYEDKKFYLFEVNNDVNRLYHTISLLTAHVQQRLPQNKIQKQLDGFFQKKK